jgi:hypothetical protein
MDDFVAGLMMLLIAWGIAYLTYPAWNNSGRKKK